MGSVPPRMIPVMLLRTYVLSERNDRHDLGERSRRWLSVRPGFVFTLQPLTSVPDGHLGAGISMMMLCVLSLDVWRSAPDSALEQQKHEAYGREAMRRRAVQNHYKNNLDTLSLEHFFSFPVTCEPNQIWIIHYQACAEHTLIHAQHNQAHIAHTLRAPGLPTIGGPPIALVVSDQRRSTK